MFGSLQKREHEKLLLSLQSERAIVVPESCKVDHVLHQQLTVLGSFGPATLLMLLLLLFIVKRPQLRFALPAKELLRKGITQKVGQLVVTRAGAGD